MTARNGLMGDKTPPQYMSEVETRVYAQMATVTHFFKRALGFGLKVERRWNWRFSHPEYHVTVFYPNKPKPAYSFNNDSYMRARKALLVVVGKVPMSRHGWHARGDLVNVDESLMTMHESMAVDRAIRRGEGAIDPGSGPYVCAKELGYKHPINLANYPTTKSSCR